MSTAPARKAGRPRLGAADRDRPRGSSAQARWIPGAGQAVALNKLAAARTGQVGKRVARADLLRDLTAWGLGRTVADVRAQDEVPAVPDTAPLAEKSVTWVPAPGVLERLDRQAERANISRNELIRRHVAEWMAMDDAS